jgi:hypothetical protein
MTVTTAGRPATAQSPLTAGAGGGAVINILFAAAVLLFLVGLFALGPVA